jgi:FtsH-binding integral membrane protein
MALWLADLAGFALLIWLIVYLSTEEGEIMSWIKSEVPLLTALVTAVIGLVVSFGVSLTDAQQGAILVLWAAIAGVVVRSQVTPKAG